MRRFALFIVACMLPLLVSVAPASADNGPHMKNMGLLTSNCAACHRAHTGKAPDLLRAESVEALCYTCHGSAAGGANLDVADGVGYPESGEDSTERTGQIGALRGGGFKYAMINAGEPSNPDPGYNGTMGEKVPALTESEGGRPVTSSHSVNSTSQIAWGNGPISASENVGAPIKLNCASCHDPHGNGNYRILRGIPEESKATTEVNITETSPGANKKEYTTTNYWETGEPNNPSFRYRIAEWCSTCHTRLLTGDGENGTTKENGTSNSGDAVYTYRHKSNYTQAEYEKAEKENKARPNCIQCHVAHGTDATMEGWATTVNLPNGNTPTKEAAEGGGGGDSFLLRIDNRGTCEMCHEGKL